MDTWGGQHILYWIHIRYIYTGNGFDTYPIRITKKNHNRVGEGWHIRADSWYGPAQLTPDAPSLSNHALPTSASSAKFIPGTSCHHPPAHAWIQHGQAPPPAPVKKLHHVRTQAHTSATQLPAIHLHHACVAVCTGTGGNSVVNQRLPVTFPFRISM
jgi:hypothetical protein